jgi:release factor glutamine methyltransferase
MTTATAAAETIADARRRLARELRAHGIDTPDLDARLLVGHALGLDHAGLAAGAQRALTPAERAAVTRLAARRIAREPVARILGNKEFWGLPFMLNGDTLLPRPETETVVEAALAAHSGVDAALRVADLGTGSGALLLALLRERPRARGIGTDISTAALACARANAAALGLAQRASFVACDYGSALAGPFDLVVSNPPYVARNEIVTLQPEVRDFDPRRALDGGPDGLDGYRTIAADARRLLALGGALVVELGAGQLADVSQLFSARGLAVVAARNDLEGRPRALVVGRLP